MQTVIDSMEANGRLLAMMAQFMEQANAEEIELAADIFSGWNMANPGSPGNGLRKILPAVVKEWDKAGKPGVELGQRERAPILRRSLRRP